MITGWPGLLLLLAAIWGLSFVFIKVADEALAPLQVALGRMIFGSLVLIVVLVGRRDRLPRGGAVWWHLGVAGLLFNAVPFSLFAYGEQHVSSVVAGIDNATTPLLTVPFVLLLLPGERPTSERVAGLGVGFLGVLVVLGIWRGIGGPALAGNLACLAAAACYGLAFAYARRFLTGRSESVVSLSTGQLLIGTLELAIVTPFTAAAPATLPGRVVLSVVLLGAFGTGVAYVLNNTVIRAVGATTASTVTYVVPLFATVAGISVLGESLSWNEPVGALIVIAGVAVAQGRLRRRPR